MADETIPTDSTETPTDAPAPAPARPRRPPP